MRKIALDEAVSSIPNGASLMVGGFIGVGTPERLIDELVRQGKRDLTVIANDTAKPGVGIGKLISAKSIRKVIASHIGTNPETQQQMIAGMAEVELVPQGTLIERIRAGGYGLGGILTPTALAPSSKRANAALTSTERAISWRRRCVPISRWFTPSWPTILVTCHMLLRHVTSIR